MHPALAAWLTDTVQHATFTGYDAYGKPTHGAPVSRPARIEDRTTTVLTPAGPQRVPQVRIFLNGDLAISTLDQITLEDGTQPRIQAVEIVQDVRGTVDHYAVFL